MHIIRRRQPQERDNTLWPSAWNTGWPYSAWTNEGLWETLGYDQRTFVPAADVRDTKDAVIISLDLPGVEQQDVDVSVDGDTLTIKGERHAESEQKDDAIYRIERSYGAFQRSFTLPHTVDPEQVKASYKDGVLRVMLPKRQNAQARRITIDQA